MKKRLFPFSLAVCMLCLLTMTSCSAADIPAAGGKMGFETEPLAAQTTGFTDVPRDAWYADGVAYCQAHGVMNGTTAATFSPEDAMTRAMLAAVLYRMSGSPAVSAPPDFTDAEAGAWYSDAISWASENGVIAGYGDGTYGVNDSATREQAVTILWRYGGEPAGGTGEAFSDTAAISGWAQSAVRWADSAGVLDGMTADRRFTPKTNVKRGEIAAMLYRYLSREQENVSAPSAENLVITVGGKDFAAALEDNASTRALAERLPLTVDMGELNGNEKYNYLPEDLPTAPEQPGGIQAGDLMLYGPDCLVLFYESFSSPYSYTRLGRIVDPEGLSEAVGSGDVEVTFQMRTSEKAEAASNRPFDLETKTVTLNSGYVMPINGLGTYSLTGETCVNSVSAALERGVRLIDTAYMYHNEAEVGQAVRESGIPREEIFLITKLYPSQFADADSAIDEALEKLDTGYIDLLLLHHPGAGDVAAYQAMERAVAEGKVRSIGLSNWYVEELEEFLPQVTVMPALVQNEIHPYYQENDVIPYIQNLGIVVQGWYPLGGRGHTAELLGDPVISGIAAAHGKSPAQVILRWNLQKGVVVIPGSSNPAHIQENTELFDFALTDEEMAQMNALDRDEKHDWY